MSDVSTQMCSSKQENTQHTGYVLPRVSAQDCMWQFWINAVLCLPDSLKDIAYSAVYLPVQLTVVCFPIDLTCMVVFHIPIIRKHTQLWYVCILLQIQTLWPTTIAAFNMYTGYLCFWCSHHIYTSTAVVLLTQHPSRQVTHMHQHHTVQIAAMLIPKPVHTPLFPTTTQCKLQYVPLWYMQHTTNCSHQN